MNLDDEIIKLPNICRSKRNNPLFNVCHDSALFGFDHNTIVTPSPLPLRVSRERAGLNTNKESQMLSGRRKKKSHTQGIIKTAKNVLSPMRLFEGKMKDIVDKF